MLMCQWIGSSLVQVIAWHLLGAKLLPKPMLTYCKKNIAPWWPENEKDISSKYSFWVKIFYKVFPCSRAKIFMKFLPWSIQSNVSVSCFPLLPSTSVLPYQRGQRLLVDRPTINNGDLVLSLPRELLTALMLTCWRVVITEIGNIVILMKFSSLSALEVEVWFLWNFHCRLHQKLSKMTASDAASDENFIKILIFYIVKLGEKWHCNDVGITLGMKWLYVEGSD